MVQLSAAYVFECWLVIDLYFIRSFQLGKKSKKIKLLEEMHYIGGIKYGQLAMTLITREILTKLMSFFPFFCLLRHHRLEILFKNP